MLTLHTAGLPRTVSRIFRIRALEMLDDIVGHPVEGILSIVVVSPDEIAHLNQTHRGVSGPTDILTFSYLDTSSREPSGPHDVVGEIYLCLEKIRLYARERGVTYREQLEMIIIHGLTHLLGYDHETEEDALLMSQIETRFRTGIDTKILIKKNSQ